MTRTIWKMRWPLYTIGNGTILEAVFGRNGIPLTVQIQDGYLAIWVLVVPEDPKVKRTFQVHGTGYPVPAGNYIGTVQENAFAWHVFEV